MPNPIFGFVLFLLAFALFSPWQQGGRVKETPPTEAKTPAVSYCELVRNPEKYDRKQVRTQATYRYGFEWSELYCLDCLKEGNVWVEFESSFKACTKSSIARNVGDNGFVGRTVNLIVVGTFYSGGNYGHMGEYRFKFVVNCLERAEVVINDSPLPDKLPPEAAARVCKGLPAKSEK